jgi:hypothetical protein
MPEQGLSLVRGMRRSLTEKKQHKIARAIIDHLQSPNWAIERVPPREHGPRAMPK